jgi:hypothetical protein
MRIEDIHKGEQYITNKRIRYIPKGAKVECLNFSKSDGRILVVQHLDIRSQEDWVSPDDLEQVERYIIIDELNDDVVIPNNKVLLTKDEVAKYFEKNPGDISIMTVYPIGNPVGYKVNYELVEDK